jgi:cytidylate kinase
MPYSFRVYLDLDISIAAQRIFTTLEQERLEAEHIPDTAAEYAVQLQQRLDSEAKRYQNLYQVNPYDITNYDLVINTAEHSTEEVQKMIVAAYNTWLQ